MNDDDNDAKVLFSNPAEWCDARCERCPLLPACDSGRRMVALVGLRRPVDPTVSPVERLVDDVCDLVRMLRASVEQGSSAPEPDAELVPESGARTVSLTGARIDRAASAYYDATRRVEVEHGLTPLQDLELAVVVLYKVQRLCALDTGDDGWRAEAVPNLLLIERLLDVVDVELAGLRSGDAVSRAVRAGVELRRALAPWMRIVTAADRRAMDALVRSGRAPSPFGAAPSAAADVRRSALS